MTIRQDRLRFTSNIFNYIVIVFYTDEMIPNYCRISNYIKDAKKDFEQKYEKRDRKPHYTIVSVCGVIV